MKCTLAFVVAICAAVSWASPPPSDPVLTFDPPAPVRCLVTQTCTLQLQARDGQRPLRWRLVSGALPPGMTLDRNSGAISGTPDAAGDYRAVIAVGDSSRPPQEVSRPILIAVSALLSVEWKTLPALHDTTLSGALRVTNQTGDEVVLTVVVVAVNQIGKAFTLGYQHFPLRAGRTSPDIPFTMSMPSGTYKVRADAVGEVYSKNRIYRANGEAGPFVVP